MINLLEYFKVNEYPDGSFYVEKNDLNINHFDDLFFEFNSYKDLWVLNQINDILEHSGHNKITLFIPNLFDAQADRRFKENQSSGLKLICEFLNRLSMFDYLILHPHNSEVVEALMGNRVMIIDNENFIRKTFDRISEDMGTFENVALMAPDAGAYKPLMKLCDKIGWQGEVFSASKYRFIDENGNSKVKQHITETDFEGKSILLVDDLCIKGGTLIGLGKLLKERNVGKLYCAFTHLTSIPHNELFEVCDKVFTTNSKPINIDNDKLVIIDIDDMFRNPNIIFE